MSCNGSIMPFIWLNNLNNDLLLISKSVPIRDNSGQFEFLSTLVNWWSATCTCWRRSIFDLSKRFSFSNERTFFSNSIISFRLARQLFNSHSLWSTGSSLGSTGSLCGSTGSSWGSTGSSCGSTSSSCGSTGSSCGSIGSSTSGGSNLGGSNCGFGCGGLRKPFDSEDFRFRVLTGVLCRIVRASSNLRLSSIAFGPWRWFRTIFLTGVSGA